MKRIIILPLAVLLFGLNSFAQPSQPAPAASPAASQKKQIFRASKDQITQVQTMLKEKKLYAGEASGKLDDPTRASIKSYQKDNGLRTTGTLNRATLEKMGIELDEKQKLIPVDPNSFARADEDAAGSKTAKAGMAPGAGEPKKKRSVFVTTKSQWTEAQKLLKESKMYDGDLSGSLDAPTRAGLKKYQEANGLKVTGTLNRETVEKMGIALTDKQKASAAAP
jgi:peptidoglycan hydrolase-like protein with peptidoglycan-binding domain